VAVENNRDNAFFFLYNSFDCNLSLIAILSECKTSDS